MKILVTGSSGLIGSCAAERFAAKGHAVFGIDNNLRRVFFGADGDTNWNRDRLRKAAKGFRHLDLDIRDRARMLALFKRERFDRVIHCAAQPSHDKAAAIPLLDFDVNAVGTANLLEATRLHSPRAAFLFMSTNKVYGDAPNELPIRRLKTRYDYARPADRRGIGEDFRIDRSLHSLFGASKAAADLVAQEYGRYFGLNVGVFRAGCVTGPYQSGVAWQGFLSHLVKTALRGEVYTVYGYEGKQVRDHIHCDDVVTAFELFAAKPRPGEVYNIGGGRPNSASVLECLAMVERLTGRRIRRRFTAENRRGDHRCWITDTSKLRRHFPSWRTSRSLEDIAGEIIQAVRSRA